MDEFVELALATWRNKRDEAFAEHQLNVDEVYTKGEFDTLPVPCLMAVCYVDAYASVKSNLDEINSTFQRLQNGKVEINDGKVIV